MPLLSLRRQRPESEADVQNTTAGTIQLMQAGTHAIFLCQRDAIRGFRPDGRATRQFHDDRGMIVGIDQNRVRIFMDCDGMARKGGGDLERIQPAMETLKISTGPTRRQFPLVQHRLVTAVKAHPAPQCGEVILGQFKDWRSNRRDAE